MTVDNPARTRVRTARTVWWGTLLSSFLLSALWALSLPTLVGFDESAQITRAASVVRGELTPDWIPAGEGRFFEADLPRQYATRWIANICFAFDPDRPAGCAYPFERDDGESSTTYTPYGNYPPLYYVLTGWPSLGLPLSQGIWAVRLSSALLCSACLASAVTAAWSRRRSLVLGIAVATTPLALALHAMVNPNALEVAAGLLTWVALLVVVDESPSTSRRDLMRLAVGAALFALARPTSVLWLAIVFALGGVWAGWGRVRHLARQRAVWLPTAVVAVACALAGVWFVLADYDKSTEWTSRFAIPGRSFGWYLVEAARRTGLHFQEMIGRFGYLDVGSPRIVFILWGLATLGLAVLGIRRATPRQMTALVGLAVLVLVLPPLLEASAIHVINFWWQGRYTLPLAVGVPILASALLHGYARQTQVARVLFPVLWFGQVASYYWALHRFTVGNDGPTWTLTDAPADILAPAWRPPMGAWTLMTSYAVSTAVFYAWLGSLLGRDDTRSRDDLADAPIELLEGDGPNRAPSHQAVTVD